MTQVKKIIEHFNPGQSMVITADEPVYALLKQNQLMFPEKFEDSFCKMGDLHIEMTFQSTIGDWLEGSGWTEIYENANISTSGRIDSFLKSSHVKRTRYAHQVTLKVLLELERDAFKRSDMNSYEELKANRINESSTALYWFTVIDLQAILFMFVRSVRESNFKLYFETLNHMLPWFFSLDHTNYARWLTVYIEDIRAIEKNSSPLYTEFCDGKFTVNKTCRLFSSMGEDQAHEQHNKVIKDDGGAVGIFDNEQAVLQWAISGPAISKLLEPQEETSFQERSHHEDTEAFEKKFRSDSEKLHQAFVLWGNPFEELEPGLVHQISKRVLSDEAEESVKCALKIGMEKSEKFKHDRVSLYQTIHRNKLPIFRKKNDVVASKKKQAVASIKEQVSMFKDLYIGCKARPDGDLNQFFSHENHEYPPALSEYGQLRHATAKSDFMKIISNQDLEAHQSPDVEAIVVDGAPWIHTHPPRSSIKFEEYCTSEIIGPLRRLSAQRIDLVFNVYKENSMKSQERERRGRDTRRYIVRKDTPIPKNFGKAILKNEKSKTELFEMVADMISSTESDTVFVSTKGESVMSNKSIPKDYLSPCNQDDADTRVFFHAMDIAKQYSKIMIITVDTDCYWPLTILQVGYR